MNGSRRRRPLRRAAPLLAGTAVLPAGSALRLAGTVLLLAGAVLLLSPAPAAAQISLWEDGEGRSLSLTGYLQSLSGAWDRPAVAGLAESGGWQGLHGAVWRLAWTARLADGVVLEVHDRFLFRTGSRSRGFGGIGVSVVPERTVDLSATLLEEEDTRLWHDLDRLAVTVETAWADVTAGRQAVSWGSATLFPVADLFGRFSPFELDTEQKPGVDAVRVLAYPGSGVEMDLVVADAGEGEGVSAAARALFTRGWGDLFVAAGTFWNEFMVMGGATRVLEHTNLRVEGALPRDLDRNAWQKPRLTLGADRIAARWSLTGEVHLNGLGAPDEEGYAEVLAGEALARGESYLLGRWYAGAMGSWTPDPDARLRLALSVLANLGDGSTAWSPGASWDLGQTGRVTLGGIVGAGANPVADPGPAVPESPTLPEARLESEFGSYGTLGYLQLALYF